MVKMNYMIEFSYQELRVGKNLTNDKDLEKYLHDVFKIRNKLGIDK